MAGPINPPILAVGRLQFGVSLGLLLVAILGPFAALLIQLNSLSERQAQAAIRLDKIETHNADTERRFDDMNADHAAMQQEIVQLQTKLCDNDQKFCLPAPAPRLTRR